MSAMTPMTIAQEPSWNEQLHAICGNAMGLHAVVNQAFNAWKEIMPGLSPSSTQDDIHNARYGMIEQYLQLQDHGHPRHVVIAYKNFVTKNWQLMKMKEKIDDFIKEEFMNRGGGDDAAQRMSRKRSFEQACIDEGEVDAISDTINYHRGYMQQNDGDDQHELDHEQPALVPIIEVDDDTLDVSHSQPWS